MEPASKEFLEELRERARHYGWSGDYVEIERFMRELYGEAGIDCTGLDFKPHDDNDGILREEVSALGLSHGIEAMLRNGHFRTYHQTNPFPAPIRTIIDLVLYSSQQLIEHGLPGRSVDDIRAALAKHGLTLKGDVLK